MTAAIDAPEAMPPALALHRSLSWLLSSPAIAIEVRAVDALIVVLVGVKG